MGSQTAGLGAKKHARLRTMGAAVPHRCHSGHGCSDMGVKGCQQTTGSVVRAITRGPNPDADSFLRTKLSFLAKAREEEGSMKGTDLSTSCTTGPQIHEFRMDVRAKI